MKKLIKLLALSSALIATNCFSDSIHESQDVFYQSSMTIKIDGKSFFSASGANKINLPSTVSLTDNNHSATIFNTFYIDDKTKMVRQNINAVIDNQPFTESLPYSTKEQSIEKGKYKITIVNEKLLLNGK